jgi:hypothetical protein
MHFTICDFLIDIIQNGIEAGGKHIGVRLDETGTVFSAQIQDDGSGMEPEQLKRALDPFYTDGMKHPGRKVGLGLPFLKQATDSLGGSLSIQSAKGRGTTVEFSMPLDNIDTPPLGDLVGTLVQAFTFVDEYELRVDRTKPGNAWTVSRTELADALGELETVGSITLLREYLESLEETHGENDA